MSEISTGPLADIRVIDISTLIAGPHCARYLGDFGADVIKVERPGHPDGVRNLGWRDLDGDSSLWWKLANRNKRGIELDLKDSQQCESFLNLIETSDVLVENLRPGKLEKLGLAPEVLLARNPKLVITRVSGFGQTGPYAQRPGFATLAEAMGGFAAINGEPNGPPMLPPIAITDEIAALVGAFSTMVALHSGVGQVVDVNLLESMLAMMGPLVSAFDQQGYEQPRLGSGIPYTVPRGTYETSDGKWIAISTSSPSVATRVLKLLGLEGDVRFETFEGRIQHRQDLDAAMSSWTASYTSVEALAILEEIQAAAAPVLSMSEIIDNPHVRERHSFVRHDGLLMQGLVARLSVTPGRLARPAPKPGEHNHEILEVTRNKKLS